MPRFKGKKILFSRKDTWSLDCVLSPIIAEGLKKFLEVIQAPDCVAGCSSDFLPKGYERLSSEEQEVVLDKGIKEWHEAIEKMIYAFDSKEPEIPDNVMDMEFVPSEEDKKLASAKYYEIRKIIHNQELYDGFNKEREEHYKKVEEGHKLFGEFYTSLWW